MLEIMTVGGGNELVRVLNAVVMTVGQGSFITLAKIALIFGLLASLAYIAIQAQAWPKFIKYFLGAFLFFNIMIIPKTTVYVTDISNPSVTGIKVDNVPYGLAYIITTAMSVDYSYGKAVDLAFSLPSDLRYSESGILLGNSIIKQASQVVIGDVKTAKNMRSFLQNCVIFDLQIGKFTYEDLFKAPDLWGYITSKEGSVKSRMYEHDGAMETCAAGTVKLSTDLNGEVDSGLQQLAQFVFPGRTSTAAKQQLVNVLPVAYETLIGISAQAEDVVKQGMVANLMLDAAQEYTASTDADAASRAFAEARMQLTTRQTLLMSSMQASTWIGYQKTVWLLILTGAFIVTAPLALLPGGINKFLVTYVAGFFWLASWGMMYAILNSIMYSKGASEFQSAGASLSMMSMIGHKVVAENLAMTAASMIDKVPWMAAAFTGLMGGLGMGVSNLVSQQMQIAGSVAKDLADGNVSFGNSNVGNHSWNNQSANKLDLSKRMIGPGNSLEVSSNGVEVSTHSDGSKSLRAPETTGAVNVQATQQIGAALSSEASRYKEHGTSLVNEGVKSQSRLTSNVMETMWSKYNDTSDANSTRDSQTQSASKAANRVKQIAERATEGMSLSQRDRAELIGMISAGFRTPGWSPISLVGDLQLQGAHGWDLNKVRDVATDLSNNKEFRSALEEVISYAKERNLTISSGSHDSTTGSTRNAYETSEQQIQRGSEQVSQGERLSQAAEQFKRADTSVQANLNDAFVNWLRESGKSDNEITSLFSPKRVAELQVHAATFADSYAQQQVRGLLQSSQPELPTVPTLTSSVQSSTYRPQDLESNINSDHQGKLQGLSEARQGIPLTQPGVPVISAQDPIPSASHVPTKSSDVSETAHSIKSNWENKLKEFESRGMDTALSPDNPSDKKNPLFKLNPQQTTEDQIDQKLKDIREPRNFQIIRTDMNIDSNEKQTQIPKPTHQQEYEYDYLLGSRPKAAGSTQLSREQIIQQAADSVSSTGNTLKSVENPTIKPVSVADSFNQPVPFHAPSSATTLQDIKSMVEGAVASGQNSNNSTGSSFEFFDNESKQGASVQPSIPEPIGSDQIPAPKK